MSRKNKYVNRSRISEAKFREIVRYFSRDLDAQKVACLTGLNRNTINWHFKMLRERIAKFCESQTVFHDKLKRGEDDCSIGSESILFGIVQREGKIYTKIVSEEKQSMLQAIVQGELELTEAIIQSDIWLGYHALVDIENNAGYWINKAVGGNGQPIVAVENFFVFVQKRFKKFHGVAKASFFLHLKESEFRFNNQDKNIYKLILKMCQEKPLN